MRAVKEHLCIFFPDVLRINPFVLLKQLTNIVYLNKHYTDTFINLKRLETNLKKGTV